MNHLSASRAPFGWAQPHRPVDIELQHRLGIVGSVARDQATQTSDIDVIVEMPPDLFQLIGLKQDLEELLDRPVDIVRYREHMNRFLKERIDKEAI